MECCPEPYLLWGDKRSPLYVLTTNPGAGLPTQHRAAVLEATVSPINRTSSYEANAVALAGWYERHLRGAAHVRLSKQIALAERIGASGVMQLEAIPFHSANLPNKSEIVSLVFAQPVLREYQRELKNFLTDKPVLVLTAAPSHEPLSPATLRLPWIFFLAQTIGLDSERVEQVPLTTSTTGKVSSALFLACRRGPMKAICCVMGSNNWPGAEGLQKVVACLKPRWNCAATTFS